MLDHDIIGAACFVDVHASDQHHLHPFLWRESQLIEPAFVHHCRDDSMVILQAEVLMARTRTIIGYFAGKVDALEIRIGIEFSFDVLG